MFISQFYNSSGKYFLMTPSLHVVYKNLVSVLTSNIGSALVPVR